MNDLPPRRQLPDDVRERLRTTVNATIDGPRPVRSRGPFAAAAGVALLAAGAVLVGQFVNGSPGGSSPGGVTTDEFLDEATMNATVDRCLAAVEMTPTLPARREWHPVIGQRTLTEGVVVAGRVEGKPFACQTKPSSIYLSIPSQSVPSNQTESYDKPPYLLLSSFDGLIVGAADPAWGRVGVYVTGKDFRMAEEAVAKDGLFVLNARIPVEEPDIRIYQVDDEPGVPPVDDTTPVRMGLAGVSVVDRPNAVTDSDKRLLGSCLAATPSLAGDWAPGAAITRGGDRFLLARDGTRMAVCVQHGKPADGREYTLTDLGDRTSRGYAPCPFGGVLPDGSLVAAVVAPEAANVELDYGPTQPIHGTVTNGTYLAPAVAGQMPTWAVVHDLRGHMVYNGPPAC